MLLQIQEMLRTERITREPAILSTRSRRTTSSCREADELSCTVMIEFADKAERDEFLQARRLREARVARGRAARAGSCARSRSPRRPNDCGALPQVQLPPATAAALRSTAPPEVTLEVDHPAYRARAVLSREAVASLGEDLRD